MPFYDVNGEASGNGSVVGIRFVVARYEIIDEKGNPLKYPRVYLRLAYSAEGQKLKIDGGQDPVGFAPACVLSRIT